jgi:anti-sigma-K factor RskA
MASDEIDLLAAEYVLGTLDAAERSAVAARRQREATLDQAIGDWENRLTPLALAVDPVSPPAILFPAIALKIGQSATLTARPVETDGGVDFAMGVQVITLTRRVRRWRSAAMGFAAIAACLLIAFIARDSLFRTLEPTNFVAVLQKDAGSPAFLVSIDVRNRALTVRTVSAQAPSGKSYELWLIDASVGAPRSLGVVGQRPFTQGPGLAKFDTAVVERATYAITVEPEGGSPDGRPSGAPVFAGKLVQATP